MTRWLNWLSDKWHQKSFIPSSIITLAIIAMLVLSGPAQAVSVLISGLQTSYTKGSSIDFQVKIELNDPDKYVPMDNISVDLTGPINKKRIFSIDGTPLSGDSIISIKPVLIPVPGDLGYGYGYGYDAGTGNGYDFGYGYGYGYGYGNGGGGQLTFVYNVTIDTGSLPVGNYIVVASLNTGQDVAFKSASFSFTLGTPSPSQDTTPPEAVISFDTNAMDLKVTGVDNKDTNVNVKSEIIGENGQEKLILYTLTDNAGNVLNLTLKNKKAGKELKAEVLGLVYTNKTGSLEKIPPDNNFNIEYALDAQGSIKMLNQKLDADELFEISAKFLGIQGNSKIMIKEQGRQMQQFSLPGLVLIKLRTEKGALTFEDIDAANAIDKCKNQDDDGDGCDEHVKEDEDCDCNEHIKEHDCDEHITDIDTKKSGITVINNIDINNNNGEITVINNINNNGRSSIKQVKNDVKQMKNVVKNKQEKGNKHKDAGDKSKEGEEDD